MAQYIVDELSVRVQLIDVEPETAPLVSLPSATNCKAEFCVLHLDVLLGEVLIVSSGFAVAEQDAKIHEPDAGELSVIVAVSGELPDPVVPLDVTIGVD